MCDVWCENYTRKLNHCHSAKQGFFFHIACLIRKDLSRKTKFTNLINGRCICVKS